MKKNLKKETSNILLQQEKISLLFNVLGAVGIVSITSHFQGSWHVALVT